MAACLFLPACLLLVLFALDCTLELVSGRRGLAWIAGGYSWGLRRLVAWSGWGLFVFVPDARLAESGFVRDAAQKPPWACPAAHCVFLWK